MKHNTQSLQIHGSKVKFDPKPNVFGESNLANN
jgi:hypothetical protein